jgi:hypothetical protein
MKLSIQIYSVFSCIFFVNCHSNKEDERVNNTEIKNFHLSEHLEILTELGIKFDLKVTGPGYQEFVAVVNDENKLSHFLSNNQWYVGEFDVDLMKKILHSKLGDNLEVKSVAKYVWVEGEIKYTMYVATPLHIELPITLFLVTQEIGS